MRQRQFIAPTSVPRLFQRKNILWVQGYPSVPRTIRLFSAGISTMRNPFVRVAGYERNDSRSRQRFALRDDTRA